jgi:hypothetical protein
MIQLDFWACLAMIGGLVALAIQYWVLRLAVRGGIEDAARRQQVRATEHAWASQRPTPETTVDPRQGQGA